MASVNPHFQTTFDELFADSDSDAEFEGFEEADLEENDVGPVFDPSFTLQWHANVQDPEPMPFTGTPGINFDLPAQPKPSDIFTFFFSNDELQQIVEQMNIYVAQVRVSKAEHLARHPHARLHSWEDVDVPELRRFLALAIYMGIVVHHDMSRYWSTDPLLATGFVSSVMPKNR